MKIGGPTDFSVRAPNLVSKAAETGAAANQAASDIRTIRRDVRLGDARRVDKDFAEPRGGLKTPAVQAETLEAGPRNAASPQAKPPYDEEPQARPGNAQAPDFRAAQIRAQLSAAQNAAAQNQIHQKAAKAYATTAPARSPLLQSQAASPEATRRLRAEAPSPSSPGAESAPAERSQKSSPFTASVFFNPVFDKVQKSYGVFARDRNSDPSEGQPKRASTMDFLA
jgi:hypothetical protein